MYSEKKIFFNLTAEISLNHERLLMVLCLMCEMMVVNWCSLRACISVCSYLRDSHVIFFVKENHTILMY